MSSTYGSDITEEIEEYEKQMDLMNCLLKDSKQIQKQCHNYIESLKELQKNEKTAASNLFQSLSSAVIPLNYPPLVGHKSESVGSKSHSDAAKYSSRIEDISNSWHTAISTSLSTTFNNSCDLFKRVMSDPYKNLSDALPRIMAAKKKRDSSLLVYRAAKEKVEKLNSKARTGSNIIRLEQAKIALKAAQQDLKSLQLSFLCAEPHLFEARCLFGQPTFRAFVAGQMRKEQEMYECYSQMLLHHSMEGEHTMNVDEMEKKISSHLNIIKDLSIVRDIV